MMGHNIHFKGVIWKIIPKLSLLPHLIWTNDLLCMEKIPVDIDPFSESICCPGKLLNRKSKRLFPTLKTVKTHGGVLIHLN